MLMGRVKKLGDNVEANTIIPASFLNCGAQKLEKYCSGEPGRKTAEGLTKVGILVAGENFGCGLVRDYTLMFIKASGIGCILAESFTENFEKHAMENGLTIVECRNAAWDAENGDMIMVDPENSIVYNVTKGVEYRVRVMSNQNYIETYPISC